MSMQLTPDIIAQLGKKSFPVPISIIENSLVRDIDDLVLGLLPRRLAVVDDKYTHEAYGEKVFRALKAKGAEHVFFEKSPEADDEAVEYVRGQTKNCDALVAVGSGTINDICKYAAALDGKPYVVFPTAASMNGYLSANASIRVEGYKKTCKATMPLAVFCDLSVIEDAPLRLNKSGFGDSLARPTAQADWLLSHLVLKTPYDETPFQMLADLEPQLLAEARGILLGDKDTLALLMRVLLLSGLGMTLAGGSYPASQAEHMIAHSYGMLVASGQWPVAGVTLHGEEVGVTTLYMAEMQEKLLRSSPVFRDGDFPEEKITALFGAHAAAEARKAFAEKWDIVQQSAISHWPNIADTIERVTIPATRIFALLKSIEAPIAIEGLGWDKGAFFEAATHARYLRERFTFLDLI